jgi:hypothetical protein
MVSYGVSLVVNSVNRKVKMTALYLTEMHCRGPYRYKNHFKLRLKEIS